MILHFQKVILHNFFSYADAELPLEDMGYSIVSGKNNNTSDSALSNGSGKSSVFNAICYALTGETIQGLSNNVENIYTDPNDCWVELHFRADDDEFIVKRIKTPRIDMKIYINGEDRSGKGIRESQQILSNYLPDLTSQLIGSIIILGQGLPYRFTYNTPSARKALLEKLTKSDYMVQNIRDKLDSRKEELRIQLRKYEDINVANKTQFNIYEDQLKKLRVDLNEYDSYSSEGSIEDKILDIKEITKGYLRDLEQLLIHKSTSEGTVDAWNAKNVELAQIDSSMLKTELTDVEKEISSLKQSLIEKNTEIKNLKSEITKLDAVTDICPTCGQKIPTTVKIDTLPLKMKLSGIEKQRDELENLCKNAENKKKDIINSHTAEFKCKHDEINLNLTEAKKDLSDTTLKITKVNQLISDLNKEELKLTNLQNNFNKLTQEVLNVSEKINQLKEEKNVIEANIRNMNEHLNVIQNLITLAKREFRSVLLANVIKYMDKKAKEYSVKVFGNEAISVSVDENYINITCNGKFYEALSGGEKQKVDIIIQLVLKDLLSNQLNIHAGILVLDEIFDNLDSVGCQRIIDLISDIRDIDSVFIISHHINELQISYDTEIVVEKGDDGISNITIH